MSAFLTWLLSPFTIGLTLLARAAYICWRTPPSGAGDGRTRRLVALALAGLLAGGQPLFVNLLGLWLESPYPFVPAEAQPTCDAVVLLGGGMGAPQQAGGVPEMFGAADRVWHAARLWRAGRARLIIASGGAEAASSAVLLSDLGVPPEAILIEGRAGNTVENGVFVRRLIEQRKLGARVLLVTSAWHMRRAMMIFKQAGLEPVPAAVDHEASAGTWMQIRRAGLSWPHLAPSAQALATSGIYVKECLGLAGDRLRVRLALRRAPPKER